jgi:glycerophosphodiester phosphodiesterase
LTTFHQKQCDFISAVQTEFSIRHGLEPGVSGSLKIHQSGSHKREKLCRLEYLRKDIEKLQSFYRVNEQAVDRIYGKIEKFCGSLGKLHQKHKSNWTNRKILLQGSLLKLNGSLKEPLTGTDCALCCETFSSIETICHEASSGQALPFAEEIFALKCAIQSDEPSVVAKLLEGFPPKNALASNTEALLYHLVELSMMHQSGRSTQYLLSEVFSLTGRMPDHNFLNHMISRVGQEGQYYDRVEPMQKKKSLCEICHNGTKEHPLALAVDQVYCGQENIISARDYLGRLSLHYGALYGLKTVCQTIIHHAGDQGQALSLIFSPDAQGYTPFHYAVIENHVAIARTFLDILMENLSSGKTKNEIMSKIQNLLSIAIRYQFDGMVALLAASQLYSGYSGGVSDHAESPLHVAAEIGRDDYLRTLLDNGQMKNIDQLEALTGWSALFIVCIKGHRKAAELLVKVGASQEIRDNRGWYAKEHAALRGHFSLAELLKPCDKSQMTGGPASIPLTSDCTVGFPLPANVDYAIINIGLLQNGRQMKGVDLRMLSSEDKISTRTLPPVDMSVSIGGSSASHSIHLPILSDLANEPLIFPINSSSEVYLTFKFFRQGSSHETSNLIGSAATLLRSELDCFEPNRESLFRGRTIPILEKETSELIGSVTFTFLIAKNPIKLGLPPSIDSYIPDQATQLVGHRGNNIRSVLNFQMADFS